MSTKIMNAITQNESLTFKNAAIAQRKASEIAQRPIVKAYAEALSATQKYHQFLKMLREAPSPPKQNEAPSPPKQNEAPSLEPYKKRFSAVAVATAADKDAAAEAVATPVDVAPDVVAVATVAPSYDVDDVVAATSLLDLSASAPAPDADVVRAAAILCEIAASPANAREPQQQPLIIKVRRPAAPKEAPLMIKIKKPPRRRAIAPTTTRVTPSFSYRPIPDVDEKLCGLYPLNDTCLGCTLPAGHLGNCTTSKNYDAPRIRKRAVPHNV